MVWLMNDALEGTGTKHFSLQWGTVLALPGGAEENSEWILNQEILSGDATVVRFSKSELNCFEGRTSTL
jgi:hypothetical protein